MPEYVVVDHHFDPLLDSWRLTIGYQDERVAHATGEDGEPLFETEVIQGPEGEDIEVQGGAVMETTVVLVPVEDFVFACTDPKWEGKSDEEVVKEQKRLVRAALRQREEDAKPRPVETMPGVGDPL